MYIYTNTVGKLLQCPPVGLRLPYRNILLDLTNTIHAPPDRSLELAIIGQGMQVWPCHDKFGPPFFVPPSP